MREILKSLYLNSFFKFLFSWCVSAYRVLATCIKILKNSHAISFSDYILRNSPQTCAKFSDKNVSYNIIYSKDWKQVNSSVFVDGLQNKDPRIP